MRHSRPSKMWTSERGRQRLPLLAGIAAGGTVVAAFAGCSAGKPSAGRAGAGAVVTGVPASGVPASGAAAAGEAGAGEAGADKTKAVEGGPGGAAGGSAREV